MKVLITVLIFISFSVTSIGATDIPKLAKELDLYGGMKATIQWERIFSSKKRLNKYNLSKLSESVQLALKLYLIEHAADSEQPIVPGL